MEKRFIKLKNWNCLKPSRVELFIQRRRTTAQLTIFVGATSDSWMNLVLMRLILQIRRFLIKQSICPSTTRRTGCSVTIFLNNACYSKEKWEQRRASTTARLWLFLQTLHSTSGLNSLRPTVAPLKIAKVVLKTPKRLQTFEVKVVQWAFNNHRSMALWS